MKRDIQTNILKICNSCINPGQPNQRWIRESNYNFLNPDICKNSSNCRTRWCAYPRTCKYLHDHETIEKYGHRIDIDPNTGERYKVHVIVKRNEEKWKKHLNMALEEIDQEEIVFQTWCNENNEYLTHCLNEHERRNEYDAYNAAIHYTSA
uniref:C3H1-type domain-containing protein n=1 Tax=viral metagenome TaxID=1070528 RepID=A0A6C0LTG2_9ZZZZ